MSDQKPKGSVLVVGVGALKGLGGAIAHRFARGGHPVVIVGRTESKLAATAAALEAEGVAVRYVLGNSSNADDNARFVAEAETLAPLCLAVQNAGANIPSPFLDVSAERFERHWRDHALSSFHLAQAALPVMVPRGAGSLFFTGASASLRGKAMFAPFASAKAAMRMLAQSLAREFGPQGIHVASVFVDGIIDGDRTLEFLSHIKDKRGTDALLQVPDMADAYWYLHHQRPSAWTMEMDLRPSAETF
ncbi:MAG: SDR family NAD(P)-dependent oxidoreductase [Marinibacterium sp.]|nr:SDR family NAD(P)-dependent oxidoreductase [Marinibacterium sp.]